MEKLTTKRIDGIRKESIPNPLAFADEEGNIMAILYLKEFLDIDQENGYPQKMKWYLETSEGRKELIYKLEKNEG